MLKYLFSARNRVGLLVLTVGYIIFYDYVCRSYMEPVWGYLGVEYKEMSLWRYLCFIIVSAFPVVFYKGLRNIAACFSLMIYVFGIIPCTHGVFTSESIPYESFLAYFWVFPLCGALFFATDSMYLLRQPFLRKRKKAASLYVVEVITIVLTLVLVASYYDQMRFVNFFQDSDLLYELRAENSRINVFGIVYYLPHWLTNGFFPFLLMNYLSSKKYTRVGLVLLGYLIVFMINMQKITFLLPFVMMLVYNVVQRNKQSMSNYFHAWLLIFIVAMSSVFLSYDSPRSALFGLAAIFVMRTVCVEGWLTYMYLKFFETGPYTWFTHINVINFLTGAYPFSDSIGRTVAGGRQNANAIFMLMDGVAGGGVLGVLIVGLIFVIVKGILNSICLKYDKNLCIIIFLPAISSLLNVSLFTAVLSCGLLVLYMLFMYVNAPALAKCRS